MTASASRVRVDTGRVIMIGFATLMLILDAVVLGRAGASSVPRLAGAVLTGAFYALIIWCYLRRPPAVATSRSLTAHVAAITGTIAPLLIPLLGRQAGPTGSQLAADLLLVAGNSWSLWSLRHLGRNLSVLAQARELVDDGPYRWIRHPLYTGEIVATLGLAIQAGTLAALGAWAVFCALQAYRAAREEQVLADALPRYRDYQHRTSAIVPGLRWLSRGPGW